MKKYLRILLFVLLFSFFIPVNVYSAPKGFKEVKITTKNALKYFDFMKVKKKDSFGDYDGYSFVMYNKLRKKRMSYL